MLPLVVDGVESYDDDKGEFVTSKPVTLNLEHSLMSIAKWEATWHKPFLTQDEKTAEQMLDYIRCMTINTPSDLTVYGRITPAHVERIRAYMDDPQTATWFNVQPGNEGARGHRSNEAITAELVYYWMAECNIPFTCEKWHVNRLLTLIKVISHKRNPKKRKVPKKQQYANNTALNARRLAAAKQNG